MRLAHPDHPQRAVRLGYCMNLHPAEDLDGVLQGMREITLPLRDRLGVEGLFGVGMWLPADVALALFAEREGELARLFDFLRANELDPFTFNAFPYGGFHREGLKESVFQPTWKSPQRVAYTLAVARLAESFHARSGSKSEGGGRVRHVSISTHTGMYGAWLEGPEDYATCAENFALMALHLAQMEEESGLRVVLSLEPEPRSLANDTSALPALFERVRASAREVLARGFSELHEVAETIVDRHLGTCLDTCHAAVEFEPSREAFERSTAAGSPLGKLQFSSALALEDPASNERARELLLALDEPVYLHQVTGRQGASHMRADDLPELAQTLATDGERAARWRACEEWRCHFHVPVDLAAIDAQAHGLRTTRGEADRLLDEALSDPDRWGTDELHVEIETYTWDVLPTAARGPGALVDGLEREYAHVLGRLASRGWTPVPEKLPPRV